MGSRRNPITFRRKVGTVQGRGIPSYEVILGSNLRALWHRDNGVLVGGSFTSWTDRVGGRVITPNTTGITFAADGSRFQGKPVVQMPAGKGLRNTVGFGTPLVAAASYPYIFFAFRWQATSTGASYPYAFIIDTADAQHIVGFTGDVGSGLLNIQYKQPGIVYALSTQTTDTNVHTVETYLNGTNAVMNYDGVVRNVAATGQIAVNLDTITLAQSTLALSFFLIGVCSAPPTAAEMALVRAKMNSEVF